MRYFTKSSPAIAVSIWFVISCYYRFRSLLTERVASWRRFWQLDEPCSHPSLALAQRLGVSANIRSFLFRLLLPKCSKDALTMGAFSTNHSSFEPASGRCALDCSLQSQHCESPKLSSDFVVHLVGCARLRVLMTSAAEVKLHRQGTSIR